MSSRESSRRIMSVKSKLQKKKEPTHLLHHMNLKNIPNNTNFNHQCMVSLSIKNHNQLNKRKRNQVNWDNLERIMERLLSMRLLGRSAIRKMTDFRGGGMTLGADVINKIF